MVANTSHDPESPWPYGPTAQLLAREIRERLESLESELDALAADPAHCGDAAAHAVAYADRVRTGSWDEVRLDEDGQLITVRVTAEIWTDALQAALDTHAVVHLPYRADPYYLDGPVILHSGNQLRLDSEAELRLVPHTNTCLVRNEHLISGRNGPVVLGEAPDENILIEGGIWNTLSVTREEDNGNNRGRADAEDSIPGAHGLILLDNVRGVVVRDIVVRTGRAFGVHLTQAEAFHVHGLTFENHFRDGVHVNGPARNGWIDGLAGVTHDDIVALNAWDWHDYTVAFGPIERILVEGVAGAQAIATQSADNPWVPDGTAEIRLLPGTKCWPAGATVACDISDIVMRGVANVRTFKLYDQPNISDRNDHAQPIGDMRNLHFRGLFLPSATHEPTFQVACNISGLEISDVALGFALAEHGDYRLVSVGPMSGTYKFGSDDPARWVELFSPDADVTLKGLRLANVADAAGVPGDTQALVEVTRQHPNPDYPHTTPRGGTGVGMLIE